MRLCGPREVPYTECRHEVSFSWERVGAIIPSKTFMEHPRSARPGAGLETMVSKTDMALGLLALAGQQTSITTPLPSATFF